MILKICRSEKGFEHASANKSYHEKDLFLEGGRGETDRDRDREKVTISNRYGISPFQVISYFLLRSFQFSHFHSY